MSEAPQEIRRINWTKCFDFIQLFRSFRLAIQPTKLLLAFCAILSTYLVGRALDGMWARSDAALVIADGTTELDTFLVAGRRSAQSWMEENAGQPGASRVGVFGVMLQEARRVVNSATHAVLHFEPGGLATAARRGLLTGVWLFEFHPLYGILFGLLSLLIWSLFGGALCRVAAMHAARDERITLRDAMTFAKSHFFAYFACPLMPILVLLVVGFFLFAGGLVGAIPFVGELLVGLLFFLALLGGFVLAFIIVGGVAGSALTFPTIATEGSDAFDALSRTFSYVYQRPWRTAFYMLVCTAYGGLCLLFVKLFVRLVLWSLHLFVGLSMNWGSASTAGDTAAPKLNAIWQAPTLTGETPFFGGFDESLSLAGSSWLAQVLIKAWIYVVWAGVAAFVASFYYSASTLMYLLLRREVDSTDLQDIYIEEAMDEEPLGPAQKPEAPSKPKESGGGTSLPVLGQN